MTDPRNIAHDKKVHQEKKHHHQEVAPGADEKPQPGRKPHMQKHASDASEKTGQQGETPDADQPNP